MDLHPYDIECHDTIKLQTSVEIWYVDGGAIKHMSYICEFFI